MTAPQFAVDPAELDAEQLKADPAATDFRSVYATAFESVLGVDPKSFLGGRFPVQPFVQT